MGELAEVLLSLLGFGGGMAVGSKIGSAVGTSLRPVAKAAVKAGLAAAEGFQIGAGSAARTAQDAAGSAARTATDALGSAGATVRQTMSRGSERVQDLVAEAQDERIASGSASAAKTSGATPPTRRRPAARANKDRIQRIEVARSLEEATRPVPPAEAAEGTPPGS